MVNMTSMTPWHSNISVFELVDDQTVKITGILSNTSKCVTQHDYHTKLAPGHSKISVFEIVDDQNGEY